MLGSCGRSPSSFWYSNWVCRVILKLEKGWTFLAIWTHWARYSMFSSFHGRALCQKIAELPIRLPVLDSKIMGSDLKSGGSFRWIQVILGSFCPVPPLLHSKKPCLQQSWSLVCPSSRTPPSCSPPAPKKGRSRRDDEAAQPGQG